jgi:glutamyl/glutaminyl-tRNA synthetase
MKALVKRRTAAKQRRVRASGRRTHLSRHLPPSESNIAQSADSRADGERDCEAGQLQLALPRARRRSDRVCGSNLGPQRFVAGKDFGDFVVWRRDGVPSYQLSLRGRRRGHEITEVVRGEDLLKSTARQILLYRALGSKLPPGSIAAW